MEEEEDIDCLEGLEAPARAAGTAVETGLAYPLAVAYLGPGSGMVQTPVDGRMDRWSE